MSRVRTVHRCQQCGASSPRWSGRCGGCGEWNTLVEEVAAAAPRGAVAGAGGLRSRPVPLASVAAAPIPATPTGIAELDRVLGGGLVPGSVTLLGGEPGIGKSTLLLQAMAQMARAGATALLVSGEESAQQVRLRAERLGALPESLYVIAETDASAVAAAAADLAPDIVVVDSIQTLSHPEVGAAPGSVGQVRECAHLLVRAAKETGLPVVLVGHVTKDGSLAGPRVLEHMVDTVLSFEGERHHALRLLRAVKHRFGATGELGLFEMGEAGLTAVADAGGLLLGDRRPGVPGSVVVPTMEGRRPLLVEVQALAVPTGPGGARRSAQGVDSGRLSLVMAVLHRRAGIDLVSHDVFTSAVGGLRLGEPAADLGVALALASAVSGRPVPDGVVAFGEIGLGGELRQVPQAERRLAEAARLGFTHAIVPKSSPSGPDGMRLIRAATIFDALRAGGVLPIDESPAAAPVVSMRDRTGAPALPARR